MCEQKRHDAARRFTEKRLLVRAFRKQGFRQCQRLGVEAELVRRRPKRRATVERIQNRVAAVRVEELRRVLERRVIDDRGLPACLHLQQELTDKRRFPCPCVAHHQEMTRFEPVGHPDPGGSTQREPAARLPKADAVGTEALREGPGRHELRPS